MGLPKLLEAFKMIEIDSQQLTDSVSLRADLGMDSQEIIELHCCIEKLFGFKLPDNFIFENETYGSLSAKLGRLVN